tara:strand:- start:6573 stop:6989 length:417 start_codon:yes stop_codon:yes gene_type:complete
MRSIAKITAEVGDYTNQSKILGQILILLDQENITCWSVESSPSKIDIVVSQQQLQTVESIIGKKLHISNVEFYSCLISFIGTNNKQVIDQRLSNINSREMELTYLNSTSLSVQYIANTEDIKKLMKSLSQIVFKKSSA